MSSISEYWYIMKDVPENVKERIKGMVKGEPIDSFEIDGAVKQLLKVDGSTFRNVFIANRMYLYKGDYTAPSDENDYLTSTNYLSEDGLAGFSITASGWLVSLFSNYRRGGFARAIKKYVLKDAYKLVCIVANTDEGNGLVELYKNLYGFRKYAGTINDIDVMREHYGNEFIDNFVKKNGTPFHVFMIGKNALGNEPGIKQFGDYFEAEEFVENTVQIIKNKEI